MSKIRVIKMQGGLLRGSLQDDADAIQHLGKIGDVFEGEFKKPRNSQFHRKFWALLGIVFDNQERYNNIEAMREAITMQAGHYETVTTLKGLVTYKAKSISFSSMDEVEFAAFYEKCIDVCIEHLMEGTDQQVIKHKVELILGFA